MEESLQINTKLYSYEGILCRRDYLLNIVYICIINTFFTLPYTYWIMSNISTIGELFYLGKLFSSAPLLLMLWTLTGTAITLAMSISNAFRRLNDIFGRVNTPVNVIVSIFMIFAGFSMIISPAISYIASFISIIIGLLLILIPGKITSQMPYDNTKIFNWGAFLGTWIWGLFNKSYKTLWYLLLWFTPWGFYFQLICGLKGNKWAYENKKCTDVEEFNKSQRTQTTVFAVLTFALIPILYFILIFALVAGIALTTVSDAKSGDPNKTINKIEKAMDTFSSLYYESHEITDNENSFFVNPVDWDGYSFSEKKNILDLAATNAASERRRLQPNSKTYYSKTSELPRTKIYSTKNKEILGEFVIDESAFENSDPKKALAEGFKAALNAYRFYKPTTK